jgi:HAE1 family hydrophobic/amphiphilic exporter-1
VTLLSLIFVPLVVAQETPGAPSPLNLSRAVELATDASQTLIRNSLEIDVARAGVDKADAAFGPTITGSAGFAWLGNPPEGISIPAGTFGTVSDPTSTFPSPLPPDPVVLVPDAERLGLSATVELQQTIFTWGKLDAARDAAVAEVAASLARRDQSGRDLRRTVSLSYAGVLAGRDSFELLRRMVELLEARLEEAEERFDAGVVTRSFVLDEQATLARVQTQLVRTEQGLRTAEGTLAWLLGEPVGELEAVGYPERLPTEAELERRAREFNPDLAELRARSDQAAVQVRVAEASKPFLPDLGLRVRAELQGQRVPLLQANWIDSWNADLTISIGASATLFDSGANAADRASAEAQYGQALSAIAELEDSLPIQLRRVIESYLVAEASEAEANASYASASERARIAEVSFENELITRADVLGAQTAVLEAELAQISARLDRGRSLIELEYLVGPLSGE